VSVGLRLSLRNYLLPRFFVSLCVSCVWGVRKNWKYLVLRCSQGSATFWMQCASLWIMSKFYWLHMPNIFLCVQSSVVVMRYPGQLKILATLVRKPAFQGPHKQDEILWRIQWLHVCALLVKTSLIFGLSLFPTALLDPTASSEHGQSYN